MKFFLRYIAPILAILWLSHVSPLGAVVAIVICLIRYVFKSHLFGRLFSHFIYDLMKATTLGLLRRVFHRRRG